MQSLIPATSFVVLIRPWLNLVLFRKAAWVLNRLHFPMFMEEKRQPVIPWCFKSERSKRHCLVEVFWSGEYSSYENSETFTHRCNLRGSRTNLGASSFFSWGLDLHSLSYTFIDVCWRNIHEQLHWVNLTRSSLFMTPKSEEKWPGKEEEAVSSGNQIGLQTEHDQAARMFKSPNQVFL